ncbi:hypothetical protein HPP92_005183 [Vanilla planifolia]|uniref:Pentatricopeptide repeat-containing protein n=1 Tax=Vanilla planifolia TaxID=51239 RepID=A0A835VCD7_VANPL|nr:hypothetical protein HPP92_005183 [Vanilla planifolia]
MTCSMRMLVSYRESITLYAQNHASAIPPNVFTFPFLLKACATLQYLQETLQIHSHILKTGFHFSSYTATALINGYMNLHLPDYALKLFDEIPRPTLPSFNAVISGLCKIGRIHESFLMFKLLDKRGLRANSITIASILPACSMVEHGAQLQGLAWKSGHWHDRYVLTSLVTMYSNCMEVELAAKVFESVEEKTIVSYNAMISGLLRNQSCFMALDLFREMKLMPNSSTLLSVLSVCSKLAALDLGKQVHCYCLKSEGLLDVTFETALIDMYSKCGLLKWACRIFALMDYKNMVTWNSMLSGLLSHGFADIATGLFMRLRSEVLPPEMATWNLMISGLSKGGCKGVAFKLFKEMQLEGIQYPSLMCLTSLLQSCSSGFNLLHGKEIHGHVIRTGADLEDVLFQTALVDMYMKCGYPLHARRTFDHIVSKTEDPASWNAMISGYGNNGKHVLALEILNEMLAEGAKPNSITLLSALSACSHAGLVQEGLKLFNILTREYGIRPTTEHYACLVDLLGRDGKLTDAWKLIKEIPDPSVSVYSSLLGACKYHGNVRLGMLVADRLSELKPKSSSSLVVLSNLYAEQGRWNEVNSLRSLQKSRGLIKNPGSSWIS